MKKQLIDKLIYAFTLSIIVSITICGISYLWDKNSVNVSFVKDVFSIVMSVLAPYAAIILFSDWKEQHNTQLQKELTLDLIKKLNTFKLELPKLERHYLNLKFQLNNPQNINIKTDNVDLFIDQFNIILDIKEELIFHIIDYLIPMKDDKEIFDLYPIYKEIITPIEESQKILWDLKEVDNGVDLKIYEEKMLLIHEKCLSVARPLSTKIIMPLAKRLKAY